MFKFSGGWNEKSYLINEKNLFDACKKLAKVFVGCEKFVPEYGPVHFEVNYQTLNPELQKEQEVPVNIRVQFFQYFKSDPDKSWWDNNRVSTNYVVTEHENSDVMVLQ